jgi:hypothetical protein
MEDAQLLLGANANFDDDLVYAESPSVLVNDRNTIPTVLQDPVRMEVHGESSASALFPDQVFGLPHPVTAGPHQPSGEEPLTCAHGCKATFGRWAELRRHMGKHGEHSYLCPEPGCERAFYRKDKVGDHRKQFHKTL